ncbi:hypothetical protein KRR40_46555 [Niabella defluvii]|nr:hypothetical protein KRR40_46555 [Niabella sp. I65]
MKIRSCTILLLLISIAGKAQTGSIFIETDNTAIVYKIGKDKKVNQVYIGNKLSRSDYTELSAGRENLPDRWYGQSIGAGHSRRTQ